jgi:hypothetical protein
MPTEAIGLAATESSRLVLAHRGRLPIWRRLSRDRESPLAAAVARATETSVGWAPEHLEPLARLFGVVERLTIEPAGTFELALWCKLLRDRGFTGQQVARLLGKSEGYVNNLVRIIERGSLRVLERWSREQRSEPRVCATDWLMQVCLLPHDVQDVELAERLARVAL